MWSFLIVLTICSTLLIAVKMNLRHDYRTQRMIEEARTTRKTIETTASDYELYSQRQKQLKGGF